MLLAHANRYKAAQLRESAVAEPLDFGALLAALAKSPISPRNWKKSYLQSVIERADRRIDTVGDRVEGVVQGQAPPDPENVRIGSGKQYQLAVMFLDVSGFTKWASSNATEQKRVLYVMDIFMAEMLNVIRDHAGLFEKNTGDGLMAYFGADGSSGEDAVRNAVEAAVLMHFVNDALISPWLVKKGLWSVRFRISIDYGTTTIAKLGIHGTNSFVAIGSTPNIANRLLRLVPDGIAIGNNVFNQLPQGWVLKTKELASDTGFVYVATGLPYRGWELSHRMVGWPAY
jgi:class 3 adenylate cyclase